MEDSFSLALSLSPWDVVVWGNGDEQQWTLTGEECKAVRKTAECTQKDNSGSLKNAIVPLPVTVAQESFKSV